MFKGLFRRIEQLVTRRGRVDDEFFDELEEALIEGDVGVHTATRLVEELRETARRLRLSTPEEVREQLEGEIRTILAEADPAFRWAAAAPTLCLVVGVNGTGKTTSIGKLAHLLRGEGKRVVLAAADTFRAAAIDQLELWSQRAGVEIVRHKENADPAAVVFDAVQAARARGADLVIADTAGRLHTKTNLMEELRKVHRVAERALGRPADEVLLVLDATIGQNAVNQARSFAEALPLTGLVLTKLDGTARGGVIVSVVDELKLPIKFAGTGEKPGDFAPFSAEAFARALFEEDGAREPPAPGEPAGVVATGTPDASRPGPEELAAAGEPEEPAPEPASEEAETEPARRPAWRRWFGG
jgi:fused signal recognition particle receptor